MLLLAPSFLDNSKELKNTLKNRADDPYSTNLAEGRRNKVTLGNLKLTNEK